jgi:predicted anti-sigma-YlaC factor YlaD
MTVKNAIKWRSRQPHSNNPECVGNHAAQFLDYYFVDCDDFRDAMSAHLDDEEVADDTAQPVEVHLTGCADCARWYDAAVLVTRRVRMTAVLAWPDVSDAVLARVATSPIHKAGRRHTVNPCR